jgi:hypothetical protein
MKAPKKMGVSIRERLTQRARERRENAQLLMTRYAIEQAMVALDMLNSRMKDFFDLWAIAGAFSFDGPVLARAIQTTFERRATPLPTKTPLALTASFAVAKQVQWSAFLRRTEFALAPDPLLEIQVRIAELVMPPVAAITRSKSFEASWSAGGPWTRLDEIVIST